MTLAHSTVTSQGQISVPASVRQRLGIQPGALITWEEVDGRIVVRRLGRFSSAEVHAALFDGKDPKPKTLAELKEGVRQRMKSRHASH